MNSNHANRKSGVVKGASNCDRFWAPSPEGCELVVTGDGHHRVQLGFFLVEVVAGEDHSEWIRAEESCGSCLGALFQDVKRLGYRFVLARLRSHARRLHDSRGAALVKDVHADSVTSAWICSKLRRRREPVHDTKLASGAR